MQFISIIPKTYRIPVNYEKAMELSSSMAFSLAMCALMAYN